MGGCHRYPVSHEGDPLCTSAVCLPDEGVCALTHESVCESIHMCVQVCGDGGPVKPPPQETWVCVLAEVCTR